jgi:hypothetical protein
MYRPDTPWTWAFLLTAVIQAVVVLAMEAYVDIFHSFLLRSHTDLEMTVMSLPNFN